MARAPDRLTIRHRHRWPAHISFLGGGAVRTLRAPVAAVPLCSPKPFEGYGLLGQQLPYAWIELLIPDLPAVSD